MKIFMDDFSVFGSSFRECLKNLDTMLQRCKEKNLALNWEKCHFMVKEGIVLGHKILASGMEVDQARISIIVAPLFGMTRMANPNRFQDTRLILFIYILFIYYYFFKVSRPESPARPDPNGGSEQEPGLIRSFSFILSKHFIYVISFSSFQLHGSCFKW